VPLAKLATKIMLGKSLKELGFTREIDIGHVAVKESVFPFIKFPGSDATLGPEMKSTGEVMGIDSSFGIAYAKSQIAAGQKLPVKGRVFVSVKNKDKRGIVFVAKKLADLGFKIVATPGTSAVLKKIDIDVETLPKLHEGSPNVIDLIRKGRVDLIINTPSGKRTRVDEIKIRRYAVRYHIPLITTIAGAQASVNGIENLIKNAKMDVRSIQEYNAR
jgi:carbamoyl-phosphate synthase large subunit